MEKEDWDASITMGIDGIRLVYSMTCERYNNWAGGDSREQEFLYRLKMQLFALICDYNLQHPDK